MPSNTSWPPEGSTEGGEEEDDALPHVLGRERTNNRAARGSGRGGGVQGAAQLALQAGDDSNAADVLAAGAIAACQASGVCELALKGITALPSMVRR